MPIRPPEFPYTGHISKLERILTDASGTPTPDKIDERWQRSYGIRNNYNQIPTILKSLKLLNSDNTPTDAWELLREPKDPRNRIEFANLIRKAYAPLFARYRDAHRRDRKELAQFFQGQGVNLASSTTQKQASTFKLLAGFGDFETDLRSITTTPKVMLAIQQLDETIHAWRESHELLQSRMDSLEAVRTTLSELSLPANESKPIAEAIDAAASELFPASHVLTWIGFMEFFYKPFAAHSSGIQNPKYQPKTLEELRRERDHNLIERGESLKFYDHGTTKTLLGMLNDRNRCAHGGEYKPDLNQTIAFMKKVFDMIRFLQAKHADLWC
jgi:hypothetical protein